MAMLKMQHPESPESISYADVDALRMGPRAVKGIFDFLWNCYADLGWISAMTTPAGVMRFASGELRDLSRRGRLVLHLVPESGAAGVRERHGIIGSDSVFEEAARRLREASIEVGAVFVLGAGGVDESSGHVTASATLAEMMRVDHVTWLAEGGAGPLVERQGGLDELRGFVARANLREALLTADLHVDETAFVGRLPSGRDELLRRLDAARARADGRDLASPRERLPRPD